MVSIFHRAALRLRDATVALLALALSVNGALADSSVPITRTQDAASDIASCLLSSSTDPKEVVLLASEWRCAPRYSAQNSIGKTIAIIDVSQVCDTGQSADQRRLDGQIVKRVKDRIKSLSEEKKAPLPSAGIHIMGGIFCADELDLSNLDLPYALVLDYSLFKFGIDGRKLHTADRFSVEHSLIFQNLTLIGSHVDDTIWGRGSFIQNLSLIDTEVHGSVNINSSLFDYVTFERVKVLGDVDLDESLLYSLYMTRTDIGAQLDLSQTEARCGYEVSNSSVVDFLANDMGLGSTAKGPDPNQPYFTWSHPITLENLADNPGVNKIVNNATPCSNQDHEILLNHNSFQMACLQSVHWLVPHDNVPPPNSFLTLTEVITAGTIYIDLWPPAPGASDKVSADHHIFQLVGTSAGTLVFDFDDNVRPYVTMVDRIKFDRVESAKISCDAAPQSRGTNWNLPSPYQVDAWLRKNGAPGTALPISAFIDAFQQAGSDSTDLKIIKAKAEMWGNISDKWHRLVTVTKSKDSTLMLGYFLSIDRLIDIVGISLNFVGGAVADYGFRPYKSVIYIAGLLFAFYLYIAFFLRVSHAKSEDGKREFKLGPYFLLDRMIPGYDLDPDHFKIESYFFSNGLPVDDATKRRVETALLLIKLIGVLAAVCLAASVKAIITG